MQGYYGYAEHQNGQTAKQIQDAAIEQQAYQALLNAQDAIENPSVEDVLIAHALGVTLDAV